MYPVIPPEVMHSAAQLVIYCAVTVAAVVTFMTAARA
jgi:hypothetical protein